MKFGKAMRLVVERNDVAVRGSGSMEVRVYLEQTERELIVRRGGTNADWVRYEPTPREVLAMDWCIQ